MENLSEAAQTQETEAQTPPQSRVRTQKIIGILFIGIAFAAMLWQLVFVYLSGMRHVTHGLLLIAGICVPLAFGTYLFTRALPTRALRRRAVRRSFFALFLFYLALVLGALIVSRVDYQTFAQTNAAYWQNFELMTNFQPLETVRLYINAIKYDYIGMEIPFSNLVGNAMLFMPMAVFLPCLFRPMQKLWRFALVMLLLLVAVEALQLLLACGSCDVDDVLLNLLGTLIVFGILKLPFLQQLLKRLYLLPEEQSPAENAAIESAPQAPTA